MIVEDLKTLYREDAAARILLDRWSYRQKRSSVSTVDSLLATQQAKEAGLARGDVIRVLKSLHQIGCGHFVTGRRGGESRFIWTDNSIEAGQVAKEGAPGVDTSTELASDRDSDAMPSVLETQPPVLHPDWDTTPSTLRSPPPVAIGEVPSGQLSRKTGTPQRIVVNYRDSADHGIPKSKAFVGTWIIEPDDPFLFRDEDVRIYYSVAITAKKNFVVYTWFGNPQFRREERFKIYNSLDQAAADPDVNPAITEAVARMGVETEELDI